ncbi:mitochondrial 54S ribosomal protein mL60 MRPL31 [Sporobolomyces salmoneus]|uniref:mitochondrial 54S ribosomal protein mL60 MRPL31 n=1 Tax=Sporobolomyces salmoneus TaxID=183962 RepID=UPI00316C732E
MFGAFRQSPITSVGLLWKMPYRLSKTRKFRQRLRLKSVDSVLSLLSSSSPLPTASLVKALSLPSEEEMRPKDKYTTFSRKEKGYRKGIHKVPQWTKVTSRTNPQGF